MITEMIPKWLVSWWIQDMLHILLNEPRGRCDIVPLDVRQLAQGLHLTFGTSFQMGMASLSSFRMSKMPYVKLSLKSRSPCVKLSHIERHNVTRASRFIQQDVQHVVDPPRNQPPHLKAFMQGLV